MTVASALAETAPTRAAEGGPNPSGRIGRWMDSLRPARPAGAAHGREVTPGRGAGSGTISTSQGAQPRHKHPTAGRTTKPLLDRGNPDFHGLPADRAVSGCPTTTMDMARTDLAPRGRRRLVFSPA